MKILNNGLDANGRDIGLRAPSDSIMQRSLAANTKENIVIPEGATRVILAATANIWVLFGTSATSAVNTGDVTNGTASELNPSGYTITDLASTVTDISIISDAACIVTAAFYK